MVVVRSREADSGDVVDGSGVFESFIGAVLEPGGRCRVAVQAAAGRLGRSAEAAGDETWRPRWTGGVVERVQ